MKRLLLPIACALVAEPMNSCGPDYTTSEDFRFWLLQPQLADARALHPFYFTTEILYSTDYDAITALPYAGNIAEWHAVVGDAVPDEAIAHALYGTTSATAKNNAFLARLAQLKSGWPEYFAFALRCEKLNTSPDPWGFAEHDTDGIATAWKVGRALLKQAKHTQLKARLAYQLIRLAHYGGFPIADAQRLYDAHLRPLQGTTWLEPSAAFYLASMQPLPQRDLAYAEIFDRATDKQFRMVQLFVSREIDNYLTLATSDQQRANLLVMRDLQHPGRALADLERIAKLDPGNRHLPLLLIREANKLEDWLLTPELTDYDAAIRFWSYDDDAAVPRAEVTRVDLSYLQEVRAFIARILPTMDVDQQALLHVTNGHLALVAGDPEGCRTAMAPLIADNAAPPLVRAQARVDGIIADVLTARTLTDRTRTEILELIRVANTELAYGERDRLLSQLHLYLGKKLIERGETAEGLLLLARTTRSYGHTTPSYFGMNARQFAFEIAKPADLDRMIALLDRTDKTEFERYLTGTEERPEGWTDTQETFKLNELTREKLLDYKATWYLNNGRLEEAVAVFRQIPDAFWNGYPYALFADDDPFVTNVEDPHNYGKKDRARYTKRTIAERMLALQQEAARNPGKRALDHYLLGNAYYNASWHGKYWIMSRIGWSCWEMGQWRDREDNGPGDDDYFGCQRAREHYTIAFNTARDPVLKALACRMLGECELNWLSYAGEGGLDDWENPWKEQLTDARSREAYRSIEECVGYQEFVARYK
ncbi:MAG: hypothetical protein R2815_10055 [Flavobacteriales bacterium]